jgi:hypothetical protein
MGISRAKALDAGRVDLQRRASALVIGTINIDIQYQYSCNTVGPLN